MTRRTPAREAKPTAPSFPLLPLLNVPPINVIEGETFVHDDEGVFISGLEFQLLEYDAMSIVIMRKKIPWIQTKTGRSPSPLSGR